jgi:Polyketide cyclase / dehydrase and lipid transport
MITLSTRYDTAPGRVWAELADLGSHADWMGDAVEVEFEDGPTSGLGTRMRVPTRFGPFRTSDEMTVVEWLEGRVIGVEHRGAVSGTGRFEIAPENGGTRLIWTETLSFPWWLGGPIGAWIARPIMRAMWRKNLSRLGDRLLSGP